MKKLTINGCARACLALAAVAGTAAGATLDVTGEATYTDANIAELSGYDAVNLVSAASKLTINIASDATISCLVTNKGSVVKQGAGALSLSNNSLREGFNAQAGWRIEAGAVALPPVNSTSANGYMLTKLYIAKDAQLRFVDCGRQRGRPPLDAARRAAVQSRRDESHVGVELGLRRFGVCEIQHVHEKRRGDEAQGLPDHGEARGEGV